MTKEMYEVNINDRLGNLIQRMKSFSYKPLPARRTYIPKGNGEVRPLGIPAYEDKLVQGVMAKCLNAVYKEEFLTCSYGFRKDRNCHQAIRELNQIIMIKKVNYIVDCDIKGFFNNVNHELLMKCVESKVKDKNFNRYIKRFLIGGVMENNTYYESNKGTPQGGLISPVLANIYLHYAYYGISGNLKSLHDYYLYTKEMLYWTKARRSQKSKKYRQIIDKILKYRPLLLPKLYVSIWT